MKHISTLFIGMAVCFGSSAFAQSACGNQDFEDTTFTGWTGSTGDNMGGFYVPISWTSGFLLDSLNAPLSDYNSRHTIITQNFLDPYAIDPITMLPDTEMTSLAPGGGSVSVRLGNEEVNYRSAKLDYVLQVTPATQYFQYQFACVMQDPGHPADMQPFFMVNVRNSMGNIIPTATDTFYSADPNVPFIPAGGGNSILYRRWTNISVDLTAYVGQTVTFEFVNADCAYGGHFGYTYLDVSCFGQAIANVWPGDADYDLHANVVDLLTMGIAYGSTGATRPSASNSWTAQPMTDWAQHIPLGANYKHSDCNGDGIVDLNDTLALSLNYAQTHPFRLSNSNANVQTANLPSLYLVPSVDTVGPNNYFDVAVYAGSASQPIGDLYGLSFGMSYDNALVQYGTVSPDFSTSWLGTKNVSMLAMGHDDFPSGQIDVGACRTTHTELNGYGYIGSVRMASGNVSTMSTIDIGLTGARAVSMTMTDIPLNLGSCQVVINPALPAGIQPVANNVPFNISPNPATDRFMINTHGTAKTIRIINALGETVNEIQPQQSSVLIDGSQLPAGLYFVQVISAEGKGVQKMLIAR